jgi:hypothetical protein
MKKSLLLSLFISFCSLAFANNMLVQNVTTTGNNATNQTIQVQFDISWDNSWRDSINWDAAWIFMKFKDANGLWQHAQLNQTGFTNGSGTANTVQVTSDKVGSWLYRSALGSGTFNSTGMQLQWNYGLSGLTNVTGLEVRVFAVEMVYVPEGDFNCAKSIYINGAGGPSSFSVSGNNFLVINQRLSPTFEYSLDSSSINLRIKGDAGLDTNNNGLVDNTSYPTGYRAFYVYKYEMTEQQYADFINTLSTIQVTTLGVAGNSISLSNGQYFSSTPNRACAGSNALRLFSYADWCGLRPMSILEFNKASYGPLQPIYAFNFLNDAIINSYPAWGSGQVPNNFSNYPVDVGSGASATSTRSSSGASYYGIMGLTGNGIEPIIGLSNLTFTSRNGNGNINSNGNADEAEWSSLIIIYVDQTRATYGGTAPIFRYVRSAE